jgi:hypothetical protein
MHKTLEHTPTHGRKNTKQADEKLQSKFENQSSLSKFVKTRGRLQLMRPKAEMVQARGHYFTV